jgi:tripartite-type tricarboxylate transporter receptor subunit TctC
VPRACPGRCQWGCDHANHVQRDRADQPDADVLKSEEVRKKFQAQGAEPIGNTPQEMATFLERERALWGGVIDKAKLKAPE